MATNATQPKRVYDIAALLRSDGDMVRELCPFCLGGTSRERSFSMSRKGSTASYICFRASCGRRGRFMYGGVPHIDNPTNNTTPSTSRYTGSCSSLTVKHTQYFKNRFNIQPSVLREYGVKVAADGRVIFPIISPSGVIRGDNVRTYTSLLEDGSTFPKAKIYIEPDDVPMSWHRINFTPTQIHNKTQTNRELMIPGFMDRLLILVEDQVSAIKASRMVDSVALLGTSLNFGRMMEVVEVINSSGKYDNVLLLLDSDAYKKAIEVYIRTRSIIPNLGVYKLKKDIKDMNYIDISKLLKEATRI